jgi:putative addiction module killer protein
MLPLKRIKKFKDWLDSVDEPVVKAVIAAHVEKLAEGCGDVRPVGEGVSELRIDYGPGWRVYFIEVHGELILLLTGGTKKNQQKDIDEAKRIVRTMKERSKQIKKREAG